MNITTKDVFLSATSLNFLYKGVKGEKFFWRFFAGPRGIEPLTYGLRAST